MEKERRDAGGMLLEMVGRTFHDEVKDQISYSDKSNDEEGEGGPGQTVG